MGAGMHGMGLHHSHLHGISSRRRQCPRLSSSSWKLITATRSTQATSRSSCNPPCPYYLTEIDNIQEPRGFMNDIIFFCVSRRPVIGVSFIHALGTASPQLKSFPRNRRGL